MVAYYDLSLLYLDKLIAEIKQSFNKMKTCYINILTVSQGWSNISHVTTRTHRAWCVVWRERDFVQDAFEVYSALSFSNAAVQQKHRLMTRYFSSHQEIIKVSTLIISCSHVNQTCKLRSWTISYFKVAWFKTSYFSLLKSVKLR